MNIDNFSSLAPTVGGGFIGGYLLAYFLRRIIEILMLINGGILALLLYLQSQEIIAINMAKLQSYSDAMFASIANFSSANHLPLISTMDNFGIPLTSSVSAGFISGIIRR
jgi:uncharacterized membrane protein (Fun14 family)